MRVLVYIGHPAQYHFFKYIIRGLESNGHTVLVIIKSKDILEDLVKQDGIKYVNIQTNVRKSKKLLILLSAFKRTLKIWKIARRNNSDLIIGTDASVAQASRLLGIKGVTVLEDDYDVIKNLAILTYPFSDSIVVPKVCSVGKWEAKKVGYDGYMKLAYLHPKYFYPDSEVLEKYMLHDKFCLIRLAKLTAHHDSGISGLDINIVLNLIGILKQKNIKVYISSEYKLDDRLNQYKLKIEVKDIHHVLANASMLISDSQSMSVKAAMLGVPSIRFSDFKGKISVLEELENIYHLTYGIKTEDIEALFAQLERMLNVDNIKDVYQQRRQLMLNDKIDVTAFFIWYIENYPRSKDLMKENPDYQYRFK